MRLFIGLEVGAALTERLGSELKRLTALAPKLRWVRPTDLHLSLSFLGEVEDALVPKLREVLARVGAQHAPHRLRVMGSGTFGPLESPKVLWTGISGDLEPLQALERSSRVALAELGLPPDHPQFIPHVTLARARNPRGDPALERCATAIQEKEFGELLVHEVVLFESKQDATGMYYRPLVTQTLGGGKLRP